MVVDGGMESDAGVVVVRLPAFTVVTSWIHHPPTDRPSHC